MHIIQEPDNSVSIIDFDPKQSYMNIFFQAFALIERGGNRTRKIRIHPKTLKVLKSNLTTHTENLELFLWGAKFIPTEIIKENSCQLLGSLPAKETD